MEIAWLYQLQFLSFTYQISSIISQGGMDSCDKRCGCVQDLIKRGRQDRDIHITTNQEYFITKLWFLRMDTVHANFQNVNELYDYGIINSEPSIIHIDIYSRIASGDQRGLISVSKK